MQGRAQNKGGRATAAQGGRACVTILVITVIIKSVMIEMQHHKKIFCN